MNGYNIISVDIALRRSGICLFNTENWKFDYFGSFEFTGAFEYTYENTMDYKTKLYSTMEKDVMPYTNPSLPYIFVVEGITRKGHYHTTIKIMLARSMMFNYIHDKEHSGVEFHLHDVLTPQVQEWKHSLIGKTNANKADTHKWLIKQRGLYNIPLPVYDDEDVSDATCLLLYGCKSLGLDRGFED